MGTGPGGLTGGLGRVHLGSSRRHHKIKLELETLGSLVRSLARSLARSHSQLMSQCAGTSGALILTVLHQSPSTSPESPPLPTLGARENNVSLYTRDWLELKCAYYLWRGRVPSHQVTETGGTLPGMSASPEPVRAG